MDIVTLWAGAATIGCAGLTYAWITTRIDRDETRADLAYEKNVAKAFENRITTLRGDNILLEKQIDTLREGHDALVDERDQLKRELGRIEAERRAAKPKRDATGRFIPRPKTTKSTPKPVACG